MEPAVAVRFPTLLCAFRSYLNPAAQCLFAVLHSIGGCLIKAELNHIDIAKAITGLQVEIRSRARLTGLSGASPEIS